MRAVLLVLLLALAVGCARDEGRGGAYVGGSIGAGVR